MRGRRTFFAVLVLMTLTSVSFARHGGGGGGGTPLMGRLMTNGFEANGVSSAGSTPRNFEGHTVVSGAFNSCALNSIATRSGSIGLRAQSTNSGGTAYVEMGGWGGVVGTTYYARAYMRIGVPPNAEVRIMAFRDVSNNELGSVRLESDGTLQLWNTSAQIGSSSGAIPTNVWARIELAIKIQAGSSDDMLELRLDGATVATSTTQTIATVAPENIAFGFLQTITQVSAAVLHFDDFALNSSDGASQNSWPGEGKIVMLRPISDNTVGTGWVDGDGAGTLFGSLDNNPPVGIAVAADGTQIKNLTSTTTGNYDANVTSYTTAGIQANDTITLVQAVVDTATKAAALRAGAVQIVSNPAQGAEDSFNFGNGSAQGTWPANWVAIYGTAQYSPSVTLGTSPVLRVGKRVANVAEVSVDAMGINVEYILGLPMLALLGVGR